MIRRSTIYSGVILLIGLALMALSGCSAAGEHPEPPERPGLAEMEYPNTPTGRWSEVRDTALALKADAVKLHESRAIDTEAFLQAQSALNAVREALVFTQQHLPGGGYAFWTALNLADGRLGRLRDDLSYEAASVVGENR